MNTREEIELAHIVNSQEVIDDLRNRAQHWSYQADRQRDEGKPCEATCRRYSSAYRLAADIISGAANRCMPGGMLANCVKLIADEQRSEENDKLIAAARTNNPELSIDDPTIVSDSADNGDYVLAWVWVSNAEAGLPTEDAE